MLISAVFIGKILGLLMKKFRHRIIDWIEKKRVEKAEGCLPVIVNRPIALKNNIRHDMPGKNMFAKLMYSIFL